MLSLTSHADARFEEAESIVRAYTRRHILIDVGIGGIGLLPIPFLGTTSVVAAIGIQAPVIYQPMVRKLGALYGLGSEGLRSGVAGAALAGGMADCAVEFGREFLVESAKELLSEHAAGAAIGALPVVGGIVAASIDALVAIKMTRIVGIMALVYFENGGRWPVSRRATRSFAKALVAGNPKAPLRDLVARVVGPVGAVGRNRESNGAGAAAFADGTVYGFHIAGEAADLNPEVLEALERWRSIDPHSLNTFVSSFTSADGTFASDGFMQALKGFVGEEVVSKQLGVELPDATNVKGWDVIVNGQEWQIKVGSTAFERAVEAYAANPQYPIITDPATAARLLEHHIPAMGIPGLEPEHLSAITEQTAASIHGLADIHPDIPIFSAVVIAYFEFNRYARKEQTLRQAMTALTVKLGSRTAAITVASIVGISLVTAAGTLTAAGPFLAGAAVTGAMGGRLIGDGLISSGWPGRAAKWIDGAIGKGFVRGNQPGTQGASLA